MRIPTRIMTSSGSRTLLLTAVCSLASLMAAPAAQSAEQWGSTSLYIFSGGISGPDGGTPYGGVIEGPDGNYYGTTWYGGTGGGTVFQVTPSGQETIVYAFSGAADGQLPFKLALGPNGNFYGTSLWGGGQNGYGIIYEVTPSGQETILQSFVGTGGGPANPAAGLTLAKDGNFYGTSSGGGAYGGGTFFRMTPAGELTVLSSFGGSAGSSPHGELIEGPDHALYGTTAQGGDGGYGTVFKVTRDGVFTVLHAFTGGVDGAQPGAPLLLGQDGNLYGTTQAGGSGNCTIAGLPSGCGTVFQVTLAGVETVIHQFAGYPTDGADPIGGLAQRKDGTLYGTTTQGGYTTPGNCGSGCGTIFSMTTTGEETILIAYGIPASEWYVSGWSPSGTLLLSSHDTLIGTTQNGGGGWGNVVEIAPVPKVKLKAKPDSVALGGAVELKWDSHYAQSCDASGGWSGTETLKGSESVLPSTAGTVTYTLTCSGVAGSSTATATVTVTD